MGEFKDDQLQGHEHQIFRKYQNGSNIIGVYNENKNSAGAEKIDPSLRTEIIPDQTNGNPRIGATTHGKQIGVNYLIRY